MTDVRTAEMDNELAAELAVLGRVIVDHSCYQAPPAPPAESRSKRLLREALDELAAEIVAGQRRNCLWGLLPS